MNYYTLDDIAGYDKEKKELSGIIDLFNNYYMYKEKGARLPKGLILSGEPGVGKTLFAKVLASQINAPMVILDGSRIEGFFGARKIKKAFKKANKKTPSMIFIDEINLFAGDEYYKSDYTKRNLSTLLRLIDGISDNKDVLVVGTTSSKDDLDEALLRSGRMDKHICLPLPNKETRKKIFEYYLKDIKIDNNINLDEVVDLSDELTGADISNIVNEALLSCIINKNDKVTEEDLILSINKVKAHDINRNYSVTKELIYHDIGHLVVCYKLFNKFNNIDFNNSQYVGNSSIEDLEYNSLFRVLAAYEDDYDYDNDDDEKKEGLIIGKNDALNLITVYLAGMACEEIIFSNSFVTNYVDLLNASKALDKMLGAGFFGFDYLTNLDVNYFKVLDSNLHEKFEMKKSEIIKKAYENALEIIKEYKDKIIKIYDEFSKHKNVSSEQIITILGDMKNV